MVLEKTTKEVCQIELSLYATQLFFIIRGWIVAANAEALPLSTKNPFIQESIILVNKCKEDGTYC